MPTTKMSTSGKSTASKTSPHTIKSVFQLVQLSKNSHDSLKNILTDIYSKKSINVFLPEFIKCLKVCLMHGEKSANVERTLDFAADFAVSFSTDLDEDQSCPLLEGVFQFIFDSHEHRMQSVRLRICQLMNRLLDSMGQDGTVVEETYDKIAKSMLVRLKDRMATVRTQAVYALHRLQTPSEPDCEIIKAFVYHMTHDPCHEVRRAVVQKIAVNKMTLQSILSRMHDIKDTVRKDAYIIINRFLIRQFTIRQRHMILETGLNDRSDLAREYVIGTLVPKWIKYFNNNYYDFLECIHVEKIPDTAIKLLKEIFKRQHDVILESRVREMWIVDKKIPYDKLNTITVIYWRALAEFTKPTEESDQYEQIFEQVLPDLTPFCQYIKDYFFPIKVEETEQKHELKSPGQDAVNKGTVIENSDSSEHVASNKQPSNVECKQDTSQQTDGTQEVQGSQQSHVPSGAVLIQLLEMCKVFDLSDEMGRRKLRQLASELVLSTTAPGLDLPAVATVARLLDHIVPDAADKLSLIAELVTELREPLHAASDSGKCEIEDHVKKGDLADRIAELESEMEIAKELQDGERVEEITDIIKKLTEELEELKASVPNEPGRDLNNDSGTLKKCLTIVVEVLKSGNITKMNPTLYSLMQNFIVPTLNLKVDGQEDEALIRRLALQCLGIFCDLDRELAKEHFNMFCFSIAIPTVAMVALKNVFDLLHVYGLTTFNIDDPIPEDGNTSNSEGTQKANLIILLMQLLKSESPEIRKTAVIGLCKLLLAGRLKSVDLVSRLILLWHDPAYEIDPHVRQPLGVFFRVFSQQCRHAAPLLVRAAVPTLRRLFRLEVTDPMNLVEPDSVANLLVELTRPWLNKYAPKDYNTHNQLAILICEELLNGELETQQSLVLLRMVTHLEIDYKLALDVNILTALSSRVVKALGKDKTILRLALKFEMALQNHPDGNKTVSTVNNTMPGEGSKRRTNLIVTRDDSDESGSEEAEPEEEEEDLSQDATTSRLYQDSAAGIEIPGTPETSDEEMEEIFQDAQARKCNRTSDELGFKRPAAPPSSTPAKSAFKVPTKTPKKVASTPAKSNEGLRSRISDSSIDVSVIEPPRTPVDKAPNAKQGRKTPARIADAESPSIRLTRSGRKRKS